MSRDEAESEDQTPTVFVMLPAAAANLDQRAIQDAADQAARTLVSRAHPKTLLRLLGVLAQYMAHTTLDPNERTAWTRICVLAADRAERI